MPPKNSAPSEGAPPKRVTLQDIADAAGVKKMVVSNALNGTRSVAPATKERIKRIAGEMNYIPNFAARALTTGRTGIVAVLSGVLTQPYYARMVHLLEEHIHSDDFHLMLMRTPNEVQNLVHATGNIAVDGVIAVDMLGLVNEFRSAWALPCVSIGTVQRFFVDNVLIDMSAGVEEALDLMLAAGRERIAYLVTADVMASETEVRARTYRAWMQRAGRSPEVINASTDDSLVVEANFRAYVEASGCPDALLCQNDETAMSAFRALRDLGYAVPKDVLLAGCDGHPHMRDFDPPLSTIAQPMEEMCATAWQFLRERIAQPSLPRQEAVFHGKLLVRKSLAPTPHDPRPAACQHTAESARASIK